MRKFITFYFFSELFVLTFCQGDCLYFFLMNSKNENVNSSSKTSKSWWLLSTYKMSDTILSIFHGRTLSSSNQICEVEGMTGLHVGPQSVVSRMKTQTVRLQSVFLIIAIPSFHLYELIIFFRLQTIVCFRISPNIIKMFKNVIT